MKYIKKPVVVEAFKYDGDLKSSDGMYCVPDWAVQAIEEGIMFYAPLDKEPSELFIKTLEGTHHVSVGDYIIRGVNCELYPCKPDIFEKTYEVVKDANPLNSQEFKNFKLHADSTLKRLTKNELVSYIHMLHHNWSVADEQVCNAIICNNKINDALDRMIDARDFIDDCPPESCPTRKRCTSMREEDCHKCWKEWCMKDVE